MATLNEKIAIGLIYVVGGAQGLEQALKDKPTVGPALAPLFASAIWNYAPIGLLLVAAVLWLFGRFGKESETTVTASGPINRGLKPLIDAFEIHAAKEHVLSGLCGHNMSTAGSSLSASDRDFLRQRLKEFDAACESLGLPASRSALHDAVDHFDKDLNVGTAYAQYRAVSQALKGELARSGSAMVTAVNAPPHYMSRRRALGWVGAGAVALLAVGVVSRFIVKESVVAPNPSPPASALALSKQEIESWGRVLAKYGPRTVHITYSANSSGSDRQTIVAVFRAAKWEVPATVGVTLKGTGSTVHINPRDQVMPDLIAFMYLVDRSTNFVPKPDLEAGTIVILFQEPWKDPNAE